MAYYSGQVSSYQELLDVLVAACVAQGWTWADGILNKGTVYVGLAVSTTGITATGGSGKNGTSLLNPAPTRPRLGNMHSTLNLPVFPVQYHIFLFDKEIYLIIKFNVDSFYYLAFGQSSLNLVGANGLWISASSCGAGTSNGTNGGVTINQITGGGGSSGAPSPAAPFWNTSNYADNWNNSVIMHGFDDVLWSSRTKNALTVSGITPFQSRQPNDWNSETIFLPLNIYVDRSNNKVSLACQILNARFLRIDNHEPEEIITLGQDRWMVLPFYKKNSASRDGGLIIDHTGTFGWAIRYDGP